MEAREAAGLNKRDTLVCVYVCVGVCVCRLGAQNPRVSKECATLSTTSPVESEQLSTASVTGQIRIGLKSAPR